MKLGAITYSLFLTLAISACAVSPVEINYDEDECANCRMKISDSRFGAELVTNKGKVYKYDSAECMFRTLAEDQPENFAHILVTDFTKPHALIDATDATFLVCTERPSPMGGDLSAYKDSALARDVNRKLGGTLYSFEEMLNNYSAKR